MLRLQIALVGLACAAEYQLTNTKSDPNQVEYESRIRDKAAKTETEMRMRIRTSTDDHTLEFEAESRSTADKLKVKARTRFNIRDLYAYLDTNANGLLDNGEVFVRYDLSNQWGTIGCTTISPYTCTVCNAGTVLPPGAVCFEFLVTETAVEHNNRTVYPTNVKIGMNWNPASVALGANNRIALVGRFRSQTSFKDRQAVSSTDRSVGAEDEQPLSDGSSVRWEKRVFSPAGDSSDVKVGVFIPGAAGPEQGSETDKSDGSSMSFRQLQFSFDATAPFSWDPDIILPTSGATAVIPGLLGILACLWL